MKILALVTAVIMLAACGPLTKTLACEDARVLLKNHCKVEKEKDNG